MFVTTSQNGLDTYRMLQTWRPTSHGSGSSSRVPLCHKGVYVRFSRHTKQLQRLCSVGVLRCGALPPASSDPGASFRQPVVTLQTPAIDSFR